MPDDEEPLRPLEEKWRVWLERFFPRTVVADFASKHERFWAWAWSVEAEEVDAEVPRPYVAPWPRGGKKSTTLETAAVAWGTHRPRRFVLVVREMQKQANESVRNISSKIERRRGPRKGQVQIGGDVRLRDVNGELFQRRFSHMQHMEVSLIAICQVSCFRERMLGTGRGVGRGQDFLDFKHDLPPSIAGVEACYDHIYIIRRPPLAC